MIRTGEQYLACIRDGREVYMNGERTHDETVGETQRESGDSAVKQWFAINQADRNAAG